MSGTVTTLGGLRIFRDEIRVQDIANQPLRAALLVYLAVEGKCTRDSVMGRLWPDRDPVKVHEEIFGTRPICPGGGEYTYNSELNAMESTVYGHPLAPREGPGVPAELRGIEAGDFGLTFERDGVRARARVTRGG